MNVLCPCCLRPLDDGAEVSLKNLLELRLPAQQKRIVGMMIDAYPRPVTIDFMIDRLYSDDPNGGPDIPERVIHQVVRVLRQQLPVHGWGIPMNTRGKGNRGSYRLEPLKEPQ